MALVRRALGVVGIALLAVVLLGAGWLAGRLGLGSVIDPGSLPDHERQFVESMRDVALVGTFTVAGHDDRPANPDRYEIASVEKVGDDTWRFNARMSCCGMGDSGMIPLVVPMRWVADTPVIMMTDTALPGIGTFTVRVFFYGDRYAGTWQHGQVGGHMSGRIEQRSSAAPEAGTPRPPAS